MDLTTIPLEDLKKEINRREQERYQTFKPTDLVAPRMYIKEMVHRLKHGHIDNRQKAIEYNGAHIWLENDKRYHQPITLHIEINDRKVSKPILEAEYTNIELEKYINMLKNTHHSWIIAK
jgi:hypothetical protein